MATKLRVLVFGCEVPDQVVYICLENDWCAQHSRAELGEILPTVTRYLKRVIELGREHPQSSHPAPQVEIDKFESLGADGEQAGTFTIGDEEFEVHLRMCPDWAPPAQ